MLKLPTKYTTYFQAILFIIFLIITSYFNRFAVDDYYFIGQIKHSSFQEIYGQLYFEWHGRWTSNFLLVYLIQFYQIPFFLTLFNLFSFVLLYMALIRLIHSITGFYQIRMRKGTLYTSAAIFVSVLFFCTVSPNDSWFWYTSSVVYFWSTIAFFFGLQFFFTPSKKIVDHILFSICALYIGGANEPLALLIIVVLLYMMVKKKHTKSCLTGIVLISVAFLVNYWSPGTVYRDEITPNLKATNLLLYTGYGTIKFLFFSIYKTFLPALFLSVPFYLLGKNISVKFSKVFSPIKSLFTGLGIILLTVILNQFIVVYALGSLPPDRSGITSSIVISITLVRYAFLLGNYHQNSYSKIKYILVVNVLLLLGFNIYFFNVHHQYADANDKRIEQIKNSGEKLIIVEPLPNSGYIYSTEITTNEDDYKNQHLKNGLNLPNDVIIKN